MWDINVYTSTPFHQILKDCLEWLKQKIYDKAIVKDVEIEKGTGEIFWIQLPNYPPSFKNPS